MAESTDPTAGSEDPRSLLLMSTAARPRPIPPAGDLSWEQYAGRACVWCGQPLTVGGRSVGIARGREGVHVLDVEVYAGPCCPDGGSAGSGRVRQVHG